MARRLSTTGTINVLINAADWAWPQAVAQIFQPRGFNALIANSPEEALQLATRHRIHLAVLDVRGLPNVVGQRPGRSAFSGIQVLRLIRQRDKLMPCLLLSESIDDRLLTEALALDVFSVLAKPVNLPQLAGQIDRLVHRCYHNPPAPTWEAH